MSDPINPPPQNIPPGHNVQKTNGMAVASLVLGITTVPLIFLCVGWVTGLLALIFGIIALVSISNSESGLVKGKGLAIAGIVTSVIAVIGYLIFCFVLVKNSEGGFMEAIEAAVEEAEAEQDNIEEIEIPQPPVE